MLRGLFGLKRTEPVAPKPTLKDSRLEDVAIQHPAEESNLSLHPGQNYVKTASDPNGYPEDGMGVCHGTSIYMALMQNKPDFNPFQEQRVRQTTRRLQNALVYGDECRGRQDECSRQYLQKMGLAVDVTQVDNFDQLTKELKTMQKQTAKDEKPRSAIVSVKLTKDESGETLPNDRYFGHAVSLTTKFNPDRSVRCIGVDTGRGAGVYQGDCEQVMENLFSFYKQYGGATTEIAKTTYLDETSSNHFKK